MFMRRSLHVLDVVTDGVDVWVALADVVIEVDGERVVVHVPLLLRVTVPLGLALEVPVALDVDVRVRVRVDERVALSTHRRCHTYDEKGSGAMKITPLQCYISAHTYYICVCMESLAAMALHNILGHFYCEAVPS